MQIYLTASGAISWEMVAGLTKHLEHADGSFCGCTHLHICFLSHGGDMEAALCLYDHLMQLQTKYECNVSTYNPHTVASAALYPFLAGGIRVATPNSQVLIHGTGWGEDTTKEMIHRILETASENEVATWKARLLKIETLEGRQAEIISARSRVSKNTALSLFWGEHRFDAVGAGQHGIITTLAFLENVFFTKNPWKPLTQISR